MQETARIFVGRHDFAAFAANRAEAVQDTRRTIRNLVVQRRGTLISLTVEGEGFLYKMVRMLTGALVRAAQGRADVADLRERLKAGTPKWNFVAPAGGLYLVRVIY
jgi:tRNA pseudouridine38-40 synthase